ncbi:MAG: hypothetical protein QNK37_12395 [Acidobacteriota bacterium]|nr:hypothetical protein [Acidobacteriota bacterium]
MLATGNSQKYAEVIAHAWADDAFKTRLMAHPRDVLDEHGIDLKEYAEINFETVPADSTLELKVRGGALTLPFPERDSDLHLEHAKVHGMKTTTTCCHEDPTED